MAAMTFSDLGRVNWLATLKVALARGFFAGIVWSLLVSITPSSEPTTLLATAAFPFGWAIFAIPTAFFVLGVGWIGGMFVPLFGAMCNLIGSALVCVGDPIVYVLNRTFPSLLNIADFKFVTFEPMLFITHPE